VVGPETYIYEQDATDRDGVQQILDERTVSSFDLIVSDMAPDTTGQKSIDAMKSV
jgi:23S rRNA U2552 (ribose-2'-O)-methylase RlmE/FtsJ